MRIVSIAHALPHEGVAHAGGEYYLRHVQALLKDGHDVVLVAPSTAANIAVAPKVPRPARVLLVGCSLSPFERMRDRARGLLRPVRPPLAVALALGRDRRFAREVASADLIDVEWTPFAGLLSEVQSLRTRRQPAVVVAHDVMAQSLQRGLDLPRLGRLARTARGLRLSVARWDERTGLDASDAVVTFSEKDARLLRGLGVRSPITVIDPPLQTSADAGGGVKRDSATVLFVAAFARPENDEAARWLLDALWPAVLLRRPDARLVLAGAAPSDDLVRLAAETPSVSFTGFVEDLAPLYARATVVVVPMLRGAGVKFKTITALLRGVPVVTTTVGAEGVGDESRSLFAGLSDDPDRFVELLLDVLADPAAATIGAEAVRSRVAAQYSSVRFEERLLALYQALARTRRP